MAIIHKTPLLSPQLPLHFESDMNLVNFAGVFDFVELMPIYYFIDQVYPHSKPLATNMIVFVFFVELTFKSFVVWHIFLRYDFNL